MTTNTDHPPRPSERWLDTLVEDPREMSPLGDHALFENLVAELVARNAPRRFAVVQEYGDRVDAYIAAWGLAFEDGSAFLDSPGGLTAHLDRAEHAVRLFRFGNHITPRLVWQDTADEPA